MSLICGRRGYLHGRPGCHWPGNKHVDLDFLAQSVVIPVVFLTGFVQVFSAAYHGLRHYMETRLLIAAEQEYKVVSYARATLPSHAGPC